MRRFILFAFIGAFLMKSAIPFKISGYPSNLAWLFDLNDKLNESKETTRTVCKTQECKKIAKVISESIDNSVDPCDDFYEYACGKWPEHNPIPSGKRSWSLGHIVRNNIDKQIKEILDEGPKDSELLAVKLAKKWYMACMDTDAMDKQGLDPVVSTLSRIGGWPMIMDPDEWDEQEYSWQKVDDQYVRLTGRNAFHDVRIHNNGWNETEKVVHIDTPHLPPYAFKLWVGTLFDKEEDESDEDPSDEQSDEPEPGSEGEDEPKNSKNNIVDDDDDDDNDDSDSGDSNDDDNTSEQNEDVRKEVGKKKTTGKIGHRKSRKLGHGEKKKSGTRITEKRDSHKTKKQRVKRRAIPTKLVSKSKRAQRLAHRDKSDARQNKRNHLRKIHRKKATKNVEATHTSTTPRVTTEEANDEDEMKMARQQYADYISKVARAVAKARGIGVPEEHIDTDIENMIEFQMKLTEIVQSIEPDLEITLNNFQEWYDEKKAEKDHSKIDWVYKIGELFDEAHVPVDGDLNIEVGSPDYFEALITLLDETPSRTIVNYIHWNFLCRMMKTSTSEMRKLYDAWENDSDKNDEEDEEDLESRSSRCMREVYMRDILAYEYVERHFSDDISKTASDMVDDIQKEVEYQIKESDWMDDDTKDFVLTKLVNMKKCIGYPDWYKNNTIVKKYFQGLIIGNSYYENTLSYDRYAKWKELRVLTKVGDDDNDDGTWWMSPLIVNALFNPGQNSITIPAANFQSPIFAYGRPQAINYGFIGFTMGHEVNHGFDSDLYMYNKNGDFVEWLSVMAQAYDKRAYCFVQQFNNYPIDKASNKTIENYGNRTAGENIADTMGLQAAHRAYQRRERECEKPDTVLPGLEELTNDQLFFLSFAISWCEATKSNRTMEMDVHSTGRLRVIGSISNSADFAKAYNCPVGSAMNPENKCNIWK